MNVLSLFDGMGCGAIALRELGIKVDKYYASEIDKHAIAQTQLNFPDTIQLGSVLKVNTKTLCLSELYLYICKKYFNNDIHSLQGIISEYEMLHRINEEQTFAAYFGAQKQIEGGKVQTNSILQINDRIWFFKNKVGDNKGIYDIIRCGERRKTSDQIDVGELCKYSFWWNGNGQSEPGVKEESLNGAYGEKSIGINEREIEKKRYKSICDTGGERSPEAKSIRSISRPCKKNELPECCKENRYSSEVYKKNEYGKSEKRNSIEKVERKLQTDDDNDGAFKNYRDFLFLCEKIQVTIVECEWGVIIYKGIFHITLAGSPCQRFSFAGKRTGMTTTENEEIYTLDRYLQLKSEGFQFEGQSYLFWEYMRILTDIRKYNPNVKFLLENVEMGNKWERVLSEAIGIFGVHINSALVSAQNRKRIFWTNIRVKEVGLFGELHSDIPQPKDEGILLKDILEEEVDEKYYLSEKLISFFENNSKKMKEQGKGFNFSPTDGNKKGNCVTTKCGSRMDDDFIVIDNKIRRLTPTEASRLQTIPEWYKWTCSDTQQYKLLGNGWNIETVKHIFKFMK